MTYILHITTRTAWAAAQQAGSYRAESLERNGFIHFSTPAQVTEVANALFRGRHDLILLCVRPEKLTSELRYEALGTSEPYPHLYGPLNLDAVARTADFAPCGDGTFQRLRQNGTYRACPPPTDLSSSVTP